MDRGDGGARDEPTVEVSVDRSGTEPRVVVTDNRSEDAWLSVPRADLCSVREWR